MAITPRAAESTVATTAPELPIDPVLAELRLLRIEIEKLTKPDPKSKALLTLSDVAELLSMSKRTVDALRNVCSAKPRLRVVKEGRLIRVTPQDLDDYVDRLRQEAPHPPLRRRR